MNVVLSTVVLAQLVTSAAPAAPDRTKPPTLEAVKPFELAAPASFTLSNGIKVLHLERHRAPLVDIVANVEAGIAADPMDKMGVASWTAAMLAEGAGPWDALAFADAEADIGADIDASAGIDAAALSLHVTATRFEQGLKLFSAALTSPRVDAADWDRVKQNIASNFLVMADDPQSLAGLAGARVAWGEGHRFAYDMQGTPTSLQKATRDDVLAFHKAHYRPDTTTLIVVGAIDKATLTKALEAAFGGWKADGPRPASPKLAGPVAVTARTIVGVQIPGAPQTVLRVVGPAPAGTTAYTSDLEVMNTLLGGSFTSRLNDNLREQHGYSYGAGSRLITTRHGALFSVRTSVAAPVTVPALGEIMNELERIHEPASQDEVVRARNLTALSFPSTFDSGRTTAGAWSEIVTLGIDKKRVDTFLQDTPKVDAAALKGAADRLVHADQMTVVAVGDVDKVKSDLGRWGAVRMLTPQELLPGLAP